jgi:hypothetical protein
MGPTVPKKLVNAHEDFIIFTPEAEQINEISALKSTSRGITCNVG